MKPPPSGAGTKEKKAYYLSDAMQFTIPYIKALGKPSGNLPPPRLLQDEEEAAEDDATSLGALMESEPPSPLAPTLQRVVASSSGSSSPAVGLPLPDEQQSETITSRIPSKKRASSNAAVDRALIQYLDRKGAKQNKEQTVAKDFHTEGLKMFLLSMLPDLQKMSDQQVRQFKRKALDAVDEILSAKPTNSLPMSSLISPPSESNSSRTSSILGPQEDQEMPPPSAGGFTEGYSLADYYSSAFRQETYRPTE